MPTLPKPDAGGFRLTEIKTLVSHKLANRHRPSGKLQFELAMEVFARLVAAAVFKTAGRQENLSLVGSIPIHFRHFRRRSYCNQPGYQRETSATEG